MEHCACSEATHLFQLVGCGKKQSSVSHSSTESEIISLDAGLRLDGLPALELRGDPCTNLVRAAPHKLPKRKKYHGMIYDLDTVDFISSNVHSSRQEALLLFLKTTKQESR